MLLTSENGTITAGVDPSIMGYGPVPATKKALKSCMSKDVELFELNLLLSSSDAVCGGAIAGPWLLRNKQNSWNPYLKTLLNVYWLWTRCSNCC